MFLITAMYCFICSFQINIYIRTKTINLSSHTKQYIVVRINPTNKNNKNNTVLQYFAKYEKQ